MSVIDRTASLFAELRELKKRVRTLENTTRLGNASIKDGTLEVLGSNGVVFRIGLMPAGDIGTEIYREDGTIAVRVAKFNSSSGTQTVGVYDKDGSAMLADSILANHGFSDPRLDVPFQPVNSYTEKSVTGSTWTDLFEYRSQKKNSYLYPELRVRCSDATTAGEVRFVDRLGGDNVLVGFFQPAWVGSVPAGTTSNTILIPPYDLLFPDVPVSQDVQIVLQGHTTAGTGSLTVSIQKAVGA